MRLQAFLLAVVAGSNLLAAPAQAAQHPESGEVDPRIWLEEINGKRAMEWVKATNAATVKDLTSSKDFAALQTELLAVYDSEGRIPMVHRMGPFLYNFWRDKAHSRGLWRRTTLEEYKKAQPKWTVLLDVDALGKAEKESWVWHGADCLRPEYRRCIVSLSRGGADASLKREFDLQTLAFVKDGFSLPEAKGSTSWRDLDTLFVTTDFGPGSLTRSSYPRIAKEWKRGTPLASAKLVYEVRPEDGWVGLHHDATPGFERDIVVRGIDMFHHETFLLEKNGKLTLIDMPRDAELSIEREWLLVKTRSSWTTGGKTYPIGALLACKLDGFLAGKRDMTVLYQPTATSSLAEYSWTRHHLLVQTLVDVGSRLEVLTPQAGSWKRQALDVGAGSGELRSAWAFGLDSDESDEYVAGVSGFLTPHTLVRGVLGSTPAEELKHAPAFFDASSQVVQQYFATSKDGTRVPYFVISEKRLPANGKNPTILYGYGGFGVSSEPYYDGRMGRAWLARGGTYVVANIRGGGEYGPAWHQAAQKANKLRSYEDFAAVAEDLMARGITSPSHLGIHGGSNGGLLTGNMLTLYPQLFGAVVSEVALLDMKRFPKLSAGTSWIAEYGDPDKPADWAFVQKFSPYHNVREGVKYPPVFFTTSTRDDRVGPAHARKMAAKLMEAGQDVRFYENIEGGHGAAADNKQAAFKAAMVYSFFWSHLR